MKRGRIKIIFYLVSFSVSLYSISRVLDPILSITSGHPEDIKYGFITRLFPGYTGNQSLDLTGLTGSDDAERSVSDILNSLKQQTAGFTGNIGAQGQPPAATSANSKFLLAQKDAPNSSSSASANSHSTRVIRNPRATPVKKLNASDIAMSTVDDHSLDPEVEKSLRRSAISLHTQGKIKEAIAAYRKAIDAAPKRAGLHRNIALAYYQIGDYNSAWNEVHDTKQLNGTIPDKFLQALRFKMPEPTG